MHQISKAMGVTVALLLGLVVLAGQGRAQDVKKPQSPEALLKLIAEAGKPGAEHKKLEPFVGDWTITLKVWADPNQPPAEVQGTAQRRWIMGGRFVQETVKVNHGGKTCEGLGLLGYDNGQKKFTATRACGLCGTACSAVGTCSDSGKKFEFAKEECCPASGEKVKGRDEIVLESKELFPPRRVGEGDGRGLGLARAGPVADRQLRLPVAPFRPGDRRQRDHLPGHLLALVQGRDHLLQVAPGNSRPGNSRTFLPVLSSCRARSLLDFAPTPPRPDASNWEKRKRPLPAGSIESLGYLVRPNHLDSRAAHAARAVSGDDPSPTPEVRVCGPRPGRERRPPVLAGVRRAAPVHRRP